MSNIFKLHVKIKFWRALFLGCKDVRLNEMVDRVIGSIECDRSQS
ncbi:hypothetical protein [Kamptonema animale]|nr:hypothetical protein [Kamptonema animale]